ncbi:MAG: hypothetical protein AAFR59_12790 [Bacteroidota bacterium]
MNPTDWKRIEALQTYLHDRSAAGMTGFRAMIEHLNDIKPEKAVVTFPYENIEIYIWVEGKPTMWDGMAGILSQFDMDQLTSYPHDEESVVEDYTWAEGVELRGKLTEIWMMECFHAALKEVATDVRCLYKGHFEDLEILSIRLGLFLFIK